MHLSPDGEHVRALKPRSPLSISFLLGNGTSFFEKLGETSQLKALTACYNKNKKQSIQFPEIGSFLRELFFVHNCKKGQETLSVILRLRIQRN
jgi:hypothetical protein